MTCFSTPLRPGRNKNSVAVREADFATGITEKKGNGENERPIFEESGVSRSVIRPG